MTKAHPTKLVERIVNHDLRRLGKSIASVVLVGLPIGMLASSESEAAMSYSAQTSIAESNHAQVAEEPTSLSLRARNTLRSLASNIASLPTKVVGDAPLNWLQWVHPVSPTTDAAESTLIWEWAESDPQWGLAESDRPWVSPTYASPKLNDSTSDVELGSYHFDFVDLASSSDSAARAGATVPAQSAKVGHQVLSIRAAVRTALGVLHQTDISVRHSPKACFHLGYEPLVDASSADASATPSVLFVSERPEHFNSATALNSEREYASTASAQALSWANLEQQPVFAFGRLIDPSRYLHNTPS